MAWSLFWPFVAREIGNEKAHERGPEAREALEKVMSERVVLMKRLREVGALIGFTRIISPGDYADLNEIPDVRRLTVEALREVCHTYDIDGIELDYMRHLNNFPEMVAGEPLDSRCRHGEIDPSSRATAENPCYQAPATGAYTHVGIPRSARNDKTGP